ncbi:hypothetical protein TeGR_g5454, partial [Tetraparma gracilis]
MQDLKAEESRLLGLLNTVRSAKLANLQSKPLRIAVIGFGRFGQFIAKTFAKYADVVAVSRSDYTAQAKAMGVEFVRLEDFHSLWREEGEPEGEPEGEQQQGLPEGGSPAIDVVVMATSILSFERLTAQLAQCFAGMRAQGALGTDYPLVVDVLSVKEHPRRVLLEALPQECDIL